MPYSSDLSDAEWQQIDPLLPAEKPTGKPREVDLRDVLDAIFYRADNGIKWRAMPIDFPAWQTVYSYYRHWVRKGLWESLNALLVEQVRTGSGRAEQPSLGIIDASLCQAGSKRTIRARRGRLQKSQRTQAPCGNRCVGFNAGMLCECSECC